MLIIMFIKYLNSIIDYDSHSTDDNSFFSGDFNDPITTTTVPMHKQQTNVCFSLHINEGSVAMFPPAKVC